MYVNNNNGMVPGTQGQGGGPLPFPIHQMVWPPATGNLPSIDWGVFGAYNPDVLSLLQQIAIYLSSEVSSKAQTNGVRTLAFNILANNGWFNDDFVLLISATLQIVLANSQNGRIPPGTILPKASEMMAQNYAARLLVRYPPLRSYVDQSVIARFDNILREIGNGGNNAGNYGMEHRTNVPMGQQWSPQQQEFARNTQVKFYDGPSRGGQATDTGRYSQNNNQANQTPQRALGNTSFTPQEEISSGSGRNWNNNNQESEFGVDRNSHRSGYDHLVMAQEPYIPEVQKEEKRMPLVNLIKEVSEDAFMSVKDLVADLKTKNRTYFDMVNDKKHLVNAIYVEAWIREIVVSKTNIACELISKIRAVAESGVNQSFDYGSRHQHLVDRVNAGLTKVVNKVLVEELSKRKVGVFTLESWVDDFTTAVAHNEGAGLEEINEIMGRAILKYLDTQFVVDDEAFTKHLVEKSIDESKLDEVPGGELNHSWYWQARVVLVAMEHTRFENAIQQFDKPMDWLDNIGEWDTLYFVTDDNIMYLSRGRGVPKLERVGHLI